MELVSKGFIRINVPNIPMLIPRVFRGFSFLPYRNKPTKRVNNGVMEFVIPTIPEGI